MSTAALPFVSETSEHSSFTAHACTLMGHIPLTAEPVTFSGSSVNLQARLLGEAGYLFFELVVGAGTQLSTLRCENTWREKVKFVIRRADGKPDLHVSAGPHETVDVPLS